MNRLLAFVVWVFLAYSAGAQSLVDSIALSSESWYNELMIDIGYACKERHKPKVHFRVKQFQVVASDYMTRFALRHKTFLESPDTLIMRPIPKAYAQKKKKEEKEIFLIEKAMDDPETSLEIYNELIRLYLHDYLHIRNYEDTLDINSGSFQYFKLHCYHILQKSFPQNATFNFMIGRWHYNYAVFLINTIDPDINQDLILRVQIEAEKEIRLALPWMKRAAELYEGFRPVYEKVKAEFGL